MINIEPIISPWVFYWIDLCTPIKVFTAICTVSFAILCGAARDNISIRNTEEFNAIYVRKTKIYGIAAVIFALICLFVPSNNTAYKMLVASYVTPDNINSTVQFTQEAFKTLMDGIVETAQRLQGL